MKLDVVCQGIAAKILKEPGTIVKEFYMGKCLASFRVVGSVGSRLILDNINGYDIPGSFPANKFRKFDVS